ncbi:predicted protein [Nematostella vectensis]|uniref:Uncharacterized protein n=3 Tax=Nematostella vectensis TaxID=45351 RepID=A7RQA9_NEMVE|nr:predicted protein [Nematostella vectensis]|eukprot:XP_001638389.1 predicted protein [Nematostella vectensis]
MKQSGGKKVTNVNVYGYSSGETSGDGPENLREVLPTGSGHAIHVENFNYVIVTDRRKILDDSEEGSASVTLGNSDTTAGMHDTSLAGRSVTGKIRDGNGAKDAGRVNQWEDALLVGNMNDRPKTISFSAEVPEISGDQPYKETGSADFASGSGSLDKGVSWISANLRNESTLLSSKIPVPEITESIDFASGSIREVPSSTENKGNKNKILEKNDQGKMINGSKVFESGSGSTDVGITGNQNEVISASDVRATGNSGFESGSGSGNVHEINDSWKIHESQTNGTRARASPFLKTGKGSGNDARKIPIPLSHVKKAYSHQSGEDDNETNYADVNFDNLMGEADGSAVEQEDDIMTGVWAASGVLQSPLDNIADDQTVIHGTESRKESGTSKTGSTEHMAFVPGSGKSKPKKNLLSPGFESLARYLSLPENPISTRKTGFEVTNELWQQQPVQSGLAESLKTYNATLQSSMNISSKGPNEANNVDNPAIDNGTRTESESPKDVTTAKPAAKALTGTGSMPFDYSENSMESEDTSSDDLMFDNTGGGGLL